MRTRFARQILLIAAALAAGVATCAMALTGGRALPSTLTWGRPRTIDAITCWS